LRRHGRRNLADGDGLVVVDDSTPSLSGERRKFVGGQAARGCAGLALIGGRWF
jgi:hypothetical protein